MSAVALVRSSLLNMAVPMTKAIGHIHAPFSHRKIIGGHVHLAQQRLVPGQILVSRTRGELTNLFIPGDFTHAAIYAGIRKVSVAGVFFDAPVVIEAVSPAVRATTLASFMLTKDRVMALSPKFAPPERMVMAAERATWCIGHEYDFVFAYNPSPLEGKAAMRENRRRRAFYCAELAYEAYRAEFGPEMPFTLRETMGMPTVTPQDFVNAVKFWSVQFDTDAFQANDMDIVLVEAA